MSWNIGKNSKLLALRWLFGIKFPLQVTNLLLVETKIPQKLMVIETLIKKVMRTVVEENYLVSLDEPKFLSQFGLFRLPEYQFMEHKK